jgi:hypothetical protein
MIPSVLTYALDYDDNSGVRLAITLDAKFHRILIRSGSDVVEIALDDVAWFDECITEILSHADDIVCPTNEIEAISDGREA